MVSSSAVRSVLRLCAFILCIALVSPVYAQGPVVRQEIRHDISPPLRDVPVTGLPVPAQDQEADELPRIPLPPGFKPANQPDAARQPMAGKKPLDNTTTPTLGLNFEGLGAGFPNYVVTVAPPDTNGAVGATQYVQWVNVSFAVFDKTNGNLLAGPFAGNSIWQGFGGPCETNNDGDPIVTYDKLAQRWVFAQFAVRSGTGFGNFTQCVAVSTSNDATGSYNRYSFPYDSFNDYPKMGVWPDGYYTTFNLFNSNLFFIGADVCAFDRSAMLNGQAATQICFPQDASVLGLLPSDLDGLTPPPQGEPNFVVGFGVNSLNLYKFHVDFATPANSTFSLPSNLVVTAFTPLCPSTFDCVPQPPGDGTQLDSLGDRLMYRLAYRNFGGHESLVTSHSVVADPVVQNSGVRWYEIQDPNGTPTVAQQSTFAPDANFRWMGSVAMDVSGNLAVGYSVSSATVFPSVAIAARAFNDAASTLGPEVSIMAGTGSQINGLTRWGDYSAMQVDPVDDCTFWYTNEYIAQSGSFNWHTRIANFKFPGCGIPDLSIVKTHSGTFTQGQTGATYTITVANEGGKPTDGTTVTVMDTLPSGLTATAIAGTNWTCTLGTLTCTRTDVLQPGASYEAITVTVNVSATAPGSVTNTASVTGGGDQNAANNSASDATTIIQTGPDLAITKSHSGPFVQGQTGTYTITLTNVGLSPTTTNVVTVTDSLPAGMTFNSATGTNWSCASAVCTTTTPIAPAASSTITFTVNVASTAQGTLTNSVSVVGGGDTNALNNSANDPTQVIPPPPDLTITKTHTGNFNQGQSNAQYTITVTNAGAGPTTGAKVTVSDTLPTGLTPSFVNALNWACAFPTTTSVTCTRNDVLASHASYSPITLNVNVAGNAAASVTNTATVAGGGEVNTGNDSASDITTINPAPDLTIAKSHTPDPMIVGQTGTYTLTVSNVGSAATSGTVTVTDFLPFNMTATALSGAGWSCSSVPTTFVTCQRSDSLAANASYPALLITVAVNSGPSVTNTASVSGGGEFNTSNDSASDLTNITAPVLAITKSHTGNFTVGQPGVYTITVSNTGKVATTGAVNLSDFLPAGMTATGISGAGWNCPNLPTSFLNCSRSDSLASNASYPALNVTVSIANSTPSVTNTANVSGGGDSQFHSASDPTTVITPTLAITKTHTGNFAVGQTGIYQITVSNTGTIATVGTVNLTDFMPNGLTAVLAGGPGWSCSPLPTTFELTCTRSDSLAPNASYPPLVLTVNVTSASSTITNTASVTGGGDGNSHSASDTANVSGPTLSITKTHTGNFTAGQNGTYTITVSNTGTLATSGTVTVQDFMPFGLTATAVSGTGWSCPNLPTTFLNCTRGDTLNAGGSYPPLTITVSVNASGTVINNANVTGGGDSANHSASDSTIINPGPVLAITKTHTPDPFIVGQTGTYTINVDNKAGKAATSGTVTVQDFLPNGMTISSSSGTDWNCTGASFITCTNSDVVNAGSSYSTLTLTVNVNSSGSSSVTNTASVSGGGDPSSHSSNNPTNVNGPVLAISESHSPDPFVVGQPASYTITVDNKAGKTATTGTVTMQDFLPFGLTASTATGTGWSCSGTTSITCTRSDSLAAGSSYPAITITLNVSGGGPSVTNNPNVSGGGDSQFHSASDTANVTAPVLAITKTHTPDPFVVGQQGTYTITVSNTGTIATTGTVTVSDNLPSGLTVSTITATGWGCTGTTFVSCTRSDALAANASYPPISVVVNIGNTTPTVTNTASVTGGGDFNNHNVSDLANVTAPVLAITKTHSGNFTVGQPGTYTITVSNNGTIATTGTVTVTDFLPFQMTATAASGTGWGCSPLPTSFLTCTRSDALASASSYPPLTVTVSVAGGASSVTNSASVTGGGDALTHTANDPTTINLPVLAISKSHSGSFAVGQTGTYTITVSNPGSIATTGFVNVSDFLPSGLTATALNGTGWSCSGVTSVNCSRSDALAGGSSYPPITVTVSIDASVQSTVVNQANVSGGGDATSHSATDTVTIGFPDLALAIAHTGNFFAGEQGANYSLTVTNVGAISTGGGTVTVADVLPAGLTATAANGTGWNCTIFSGPQTEMDCTRPAGVLAQNAAYPSITLSVNVSSGAAASVTNSANVFGITESGYGNNTASDPTNIAPLAISSISSSSVTVSAGSPGTFSFQISIGTNPPAGPVTFALAGLPPNAKVTFNPTSLTQSGQVTMTVDTSGNGHVASGTPMSLPGDRSAPLYALLVLPGLAALAFGIRDRKVRRWLWAGASVSVLVIVLSIAGCGGGSGGPPSTPTPTPTPIPTPTPPPVTPVGTYPLTVTANGTSASSTAQVTLVVQ